MNEIFIDQLLKLAISPYGLIGVVAGLWLITQANRSRQLAWLLVSLCGFTASLSKFKDDFITEPPILVFPLEQLRDVGRPLTIALLGLLIVLALRTPKNWRRGVFPRPINYLLLVQLVILLKTLAYGSVTFAFLAILTFTGMAFMLRMGPGRWLQDDENFKLAVWAVAMVGVIFIVANTYQYLIDPYAVTFVHGRFLGTTGNPQHAAVLLAATIPSFMFLFENQPKWNWVKLSWLVSLISVMYYLLLTGSRTGVLMGAVVILFFYRQNSGAWFRLGLGLTILLAVFLTFSSPEHFGLGGIDPSVSRRFTSTNDTRSEVSAALWNGFISNPFFGTPLRGDRLGYGENSWLAAGATLGLAGFIPMLMVGWECLKLIWQLNQISNRRPQYFFQVSSVVAGLASLLVGSFFEAFLLGNLTFSLLAFLIYLFMGQYLVEVDQIQTHYSTIESNFVEPPGVNNY